MKSVYNFVLPEVDFELRTDKMSFLEFWQKNTLFGKTNYSMFHYSLRVIDEPKTSEIRMLKLYQKGGFGRYLQTVALKTKKLYIYLTDFKTKSKN